MYRGLLGKTKRDFEVNQKRALLCFDSFASLCIFDYSENVTRESFCRRIAFVRAAFRRRDF